MCVAEAQVMMNCSNEYEMREKMSNIKNISIFTMSDNHCYNLLRVNTKEDGKLFKNLLNKAI